MPFQVSVVKRPPAFLAGDHDDVPAWHSCGPQPDPSNHSGNLELRIRADVARTRQTGHFVRFVFAEQLLGQQKSANSLGTGAPAATRTRASQAVASRGEVTSRSEAKAGPPAWKARRLEWMANIGLEGPSSETLKKRPVFADSADPIGYVVTVISCDPPLHARCEYWPESPHCWATRTRR